MKIICYGDSNTYGFDPRIGTPGRQAKKDRWTGILDNMPEYEIINEGMNGRTIPDCDAAYNSLGSIIRHNMSADILLIMLGTNDMFMLRGATAAVLGERMRAMFENVPELRSFRDCTGKRICLISPPAPSRRVLFYEMIGVPASQTADEVAGIMEELPGVYAQVASDWQVDFIDAGKWNIELLFDGLHFSEKGHREFARQMEEKLKSLI
jgi:lysophospholipase L1-like esterase